jgi:hypothetical protein
MGLQNLDSVIRAGNGMYCALSLQSGPSMLVIHINDLAPFMLTNDNFSQRFSSVFVAVTMVATVLVEGKAQFTPLHA